MLVRSIALGVAAVALLSSAANAADLIIPTTPAPIMESAGFSWDGLYVGARAGGEFIGQNNGFGIANRANNTSYGVIGAVAGVNYTVSAPFLVGAEVTGDYVWNNGLSSGEFFANLRAGAVVTDAVLVYAIGGVGIQTGNGNNNNNGLYQLGGGVEVAVTDAISIRGEVVGLGDFDGANDAFFEAAKATVGVFYHF